MLARRGFLSTAAAFFLAPFKTLLGDSPKDRTTQLLRPPAAVTLQEERIVREFYEQGFNGRRKDVLEKYLAKEKAEQCQIIMSVCMVFVAVIEVVRMVRVGDYIDVIWTARGVHKGVYKGIQPTGRNVSVSGHTKMRIVDGKIVSIAADWDENDLLRKLRTPQDLLAPRRGS